MILGTVGTHTAPFDRLVRALDAYAGSAGADVLIQIGASRYEPSHARWFRMTTTEAMQEHLEHATVVVTHAADSLLEAIHAGKPVVAVPRQRRFGEHIDDHQVELARALAGSPRLVVVEDVSQLGAALADAIPPPDRERPAAQADRLVGALRRAIRELS